MREIIGGSWFTVDDECRLYGKAVGVDECHLTFEAPQQHQHKIMFTAAALRAFVATGTDLLQQMAAKVGEGNVAVVTSERSS